MSIEHIRLSQQARHQLLRLKRRSGIKNWNILCRWALCVSLAEPTNPPDTEIPADSSVEMTWKVFAGEYQDIYLALLKQRCKSAGLPLTPGVLGRQLRMHLHRGIGYLYADRGIRTIEGLVCRVLPKRL